MEKKNIHIEMYSPLLFLSALGAGGIAITFFMYLFFFIPRNREQFPIPSFESIFLQWQASTFYKGIIIVSHISILFFAVLHILLLIWNLKARFEYKKTPEFQKILQSPQEVSIMAIPLTLAMTVNICFILWSLFIPGLWNIIEYLFPIALWVYGIIGIVALKMFFHYFIKLITKSPWENSFDITQLNHFSQMISVFAFAMIAVWFAAPAAMSHNTVTIGVSIIGSIFFITVALFFFFIKMVIGIQAILQKWIDRIGSPSIWIIIPFLTIVGITFLRQSHGFQEFWVAFSFGNFLKISTVLLSLQIIFWYIGYIVMKKNKYFEEYLYGKEFIPNSFALVCPWVAIVVFWFFFIHNALIKTGILVQWSPMYMLLISILFYFQFVTIHVFFVLNKKLFQKIYS